MLSLAAKTINHSVSPSERATAELIDASARFHQSVLPVRLLRELQFRGDTIHDDLVDTIERAIQADGKGLGVQLPPAFFAFALLIPIARPDDLPLIETLLTLPDDKLYELLGDLSHEGMSHFISATITDDNKAEVLDRLGRL